MSGRLGVRELVVDQLHTMRLVGSDHISPVDLLVFAGAPLAGGIAVLLFDGRFRGASDVLAGVSLLTGLLFALLVHVFTLRLRIVDMPQYTPSSRVSALVDDLRANVSYACAVSLGLTVLLVAGSVNAGPRAETNGLHPVLSGAITMVGGHLVIILLALIKKLRTAYKLLS